MDNKQLYRTLCESPGSTIPVFQQAWWMDVVCQGKEWDVLLAMDGDRPLAALPCLIRRRLGMTYVLQPQLTQFTGPLFFTPADLSAARRPDFEHRVCQMLIDQLGALRLDYYCQCFAPTVTDWLPFYWAGYRQTTRYTYRLDDISDPQRVFDNFDRTKERQRRIRRIADSYTVDTAIDADTFATFHADYWHSRGQRDVTPHTLIRSVVDTATTRRQGLTLGLRDAKGDLRAAWFAVYDSRCAHALLSAKAPDETSADTTALLVWRLIEALSPHTAAFDFEGSMEPSLEYFYRSFGARQVPYHQVSLVRNRIIPLLLRMKKK